MSENIWDEKPTYFAFVCKLPVAGLACCPPSPPSLVAANGPLVSGLRGPRACTHLRRSQRGHLEHLESLVGLLKSTNIANEITKDALRRLSKLVLTVWRGSHVEPQIVVNCPTRWSLFFIFVFLCWSTNKYQKYKSVELGDQLLSDRPRCKIKAIVIEISNEWGGGHIYDKNTIF